MRKSEPGDHFPGPNASNRAVADIFQVWDGRIAYTSLISEKNCKAIRCYLGKYKGY